MHNESFTKLKWLITYREITNASPKYDKKTHIYIQWAKGFLLPHHN